MVEQDRTEIERHHFQITLRLCLTDKELPKLVPAGTKNEWPTHLSEQTLAELLICVHVERIVKRN